MRFGCCGSIDNAAVLKQAGFDFLEVNIQGVLKGDEPSATWDAAAPDPAKVALPIEAANSLVPGNRPVVGPARDMAGLQDYMQRVAKRGQRLGIKRFVFGSGGARKRPEGVSQETADEQLLEFTRMAGEVCAHHDIILVIEHLNKGETNTLNALDACAALCTQVDLPSVQMLVDSYHFGLEKENMSSVIKLGNTLRHVHVAEVVGRSQPGVQVPEAKPSDAFDFVDLFQALRKIGYDERISIECKWTGPLDQHAGNALKFLKAAWEESGKP
jgi:sugar phosphate isomerase/epimerase